MFDPSSALLLFTIFQATEKVIEHAGGKIADAIAKPIEAALEDKAKWLAGTDETAKRWRAFTQAFDEAQVQFLNEAPRLDTAVKVLNALKSSNIQPQLKNNLLTDPNEGELKKLSFLEHPDPEKITELCLVTIKKKTLTPAARADIVDSVKVFIRVFRDRLFQQSAYRKWVLEETEWQLSKQPLYDSRERYIAQIIAYHQDLEFVGIPELKDRQALRIEDIFIHLQTDEEGDEVDRQKVLVANLLARIRAL
jgi:hypothetical protein